MRNKALILLAAILLLSMVACANITPFYWSTMVLADSPPSESSNIMIVFYTIDDAQYLFWCDLSAVITDNGNGTWDVNSPQVTAGGVNQATVTYEYYQYQEIVPNMDEEGNLIPIYMTELNLQPVTAGDLPQSEHIGKLVAVDTGLAKPATVRRWWQGNAYDVQCLVEQTVVDQWLADTLNIGDWVVVSFITENPETEEIELAVVRGKLYKSWGS